MLLRSVFQILLIQKLPALHLLVPLILGCSDYLVLYFTWDLLLVSLQLFQEP